MFILETAKTFYRLIPLLAWFISLPISLYAFPPTFPEPDIDTTITFNGDLILDSSQLMTIENTHFIVNGQIFLKDSAQLIVRQSMIEINHHPTASIHISEKARLEADTTIFGGTGLLGGVDPSEVEMFEWQDISVFGQGHVDMQNCFSLIQTFGGNSTAVIRDSYLLQEPLGLIHAEGQTVVLIEDSYVGAIFIDVPREVPISIDNLVPGYFEHWSLRENFSDSLGYDIILNRSELNDNDAGYEGGMEMGWNIAVNSDGSADVSNSKLNKLIIGFHDSTAVFISDLRIRQPIDFDYGSIHLTNTEIQTQWGIFLNGQPSTIINSEGLFIFMTGGNEIVSVFNSYLNEIDPRKYSGTLFLDNSSWCCGYEVFDSSAIFVEGSVRMLRTLPIFDATSRMTRHYDVHLLRDADGSPWPGLELELTKDDNTIWSGITDSNGDVNFNITFDDSTFDENWILSCTDSLINLNKKINIEITNPVMISLELEEDHAHYRPVIHVDASFTGFPTGTRFAPYPAIQEAIDNSGGDIIRVSAGEYPGEITPGDTLGFVNLKDSVVIIGEGAEVTKLTGQFFTEFLTGASVSGLTVERGFHILSSSMTIRNTVISGCREHAIYARNSTIDIINNTIANNSMTGIFLSDSSQANIINNIIVNNAMNGIDGAETATANIDYNDVWGNTVNYFEFFTPGAHDISTDPLFVDEMNEDYHLLEGSPCINSGDPSFDPPRGGACVIDMGAFEYWQGISCDKKEPSGSLIVPTKQLTPIPR